MLQNKLKVMVVDDSALVREFMRQLISAQSDMEVVTASDPYMARDKMLKEMPDVIILDVEMPKMDGLTFLQKVMNFRPIPVIMFSSVTRHGAEEAINAMSMGAVDVVAKPTQNIKVELNNLKDDLLNKIRAVAGKKVQKKTNPTAMQVTSKVDIDQLLPLKIPLRSKGPLVVLMGASTGGTDALEKVLLNLPANCPPIAIVQHMPENLTLAFANRLNSKCQMNVFEAVDGQQLPPGTCLIAPGGARHMFLEKDKSTGGYLVRLKEGPPVNRHRPSVDVLFRSGANSAGGNALAIIMTGMGDDGAQGVKDLHDAGAMTVAQNEQTCVVYGMPKMAVQKGGVDRVVPLNDIAGVIKEQWIHARG